MEGKQERRNGGRERTKEEEGGRNGRKERKVREKESDRNDLYCTK